MRSFRLPMIRLKVRCTMLLHLLPFHLVEPERVDALIHDIKLKKVNDKDLAQRLEALVAEGGSLPVVLACTDFPTVPANFATQTTIDATRALATSLISAAVRT